MSWVDFEAIRDVWVQIGKAFARKPEAGGSLSWSSPSLALRSVDGGDLGSVNLDDGLATDAEAGHSLGINGRTITLHNVNGAQLGSGVTVPATDVSDKANVNWVKDNCIGSVDVEKVNNKTIIHFYDLNGNQQDSITLP